MRIEVTYTQKIVKVLETENIWTADAVAEVNKPEGFVLEDYFKINENDEEYLNNLRVQNLIS